MQDNPHEFLHLSSAELRFFTWFAPIVSSLYILEGHTTLETMLLTFGCILGGGVIEKTVKNLRDLFH